METWLKISLMLCLFGFLKEMRPSDPFVYEFLSGEWRNITSEEVIRYVYPVATYSYLSQLVIVFLITDLCRYKPLIIVLGLSGIVVWSMLLWTYSLWELQVLEVSCTCFLLEWYDNKYWRSLISFVSYIMYCTLLTNKDSLNNCLSGKIIGSDMQLYLFSFHHNINEGI